MWGVACVWCVCRCVWSGVCVGVWCVHIVVCEVVYGVFVCGMCVGVYGVVYGVLCVVCIDMYVVVFEV